MSVSKLDFSGGPGSWFDLWHTHVDWKGEGNKNWTVREKFLTKLFRLFRQYKTALKSYPNDYQLWIEIDVNDSGEDAVYIHTKNPNSDNFPIKVPGDKIIRTRNAKLQALLKSTDLEIIRYKSKAGYIYYMFDKSVGITLE
jgi:hypothetical protein